MEPINWIIFWSALFIAALIVLILLVTEHRKMENRATAKAVIELQTEQGDKITLTFYSGATRQEILDLLKVTVASIREAHTSYRLVTGKGEK